MSPCNTKFLSAWSWVSALCCVTLLTWSCSTDSKVKTLEKIQAQQQSWHKVVNDFEQQMGQAAQYHKTFMQPYLDTLPSVARKKFLGDSLFRVNISQLKFKYEDWTSQQIMATRRIRIFLKKHKHWVSLISSKRPPYPVRERDWRSRETKFERLRKVCEALQLKYSALKARYASVGETPILPTNPK